MSYMLIELSTGNVLGFFPTEREALQEVTESIKEDGLASVRTLGLGYNDPAGPVRKIADGAELVLRAVRATSSAFREPSSTHDQEPARDPATPEATLNDFDAAALRQAVAQLSDRQQLVILLYFAADLTTTGIASLLDTSPMAIRHIRHQALSKLRTALRQNQISTESANKQATASPLEEWLRSNRGGPTSEQLPKAAAEAITAALVAS